MEPDEKSLLESGITAFAVKAKWLRERAGLSQIALEREMNRREEGPSQKTVSNIENQKYSSQIGNLAAVAAYFKVPLWVMFIPELHTDNLEPDKLKRLATLVEDYLSCDNAEREFVEKMAAGYAGLRRRK